MKQKIIHKQEPNLKRKSLVFFAMAALFMVILGVLAPNPNVAKAATTYTNGDINFTTELAINGQADNLIRILETGGDAVQLTVSLTIRTKQNSSSIIVGGPTPDIIDTGSQIASNRELLGIGNVLIPSDQSGCSSLGLVNIPFIANTKQYFDCDLGSGKSQGIQASMTDPAKQVPVGQKISYTFTLDQAKLRSLKAGPNATGGATPFFYAAPWLQFKVIGAGTKNMTVYDAGKQIFVQYFKTQPELEQAAAAKTRPDDVPPYGANSGAASFGEKGSPLLGLVNQLINVLVGILKQFIYNVFYYLIAPIIQAMLSIRTYTDTFAAVIYPGWEIVRNVCNILFIVALIAIGLGTLFRLESYQYKHMLVDLIIAALLVNFSLVIAQAVLGVADTVQSQFLPNNVEVIRSLARDLMAGWGNVNWNDLSASGFFADTVQPLFALALTIGSFVVFSAIAIFLFVRIIMLWVLLMLSPLAYALRVLPSTKSYAGKWWSEFLKYAFFTPIMAFFLNMAAVINSTYNAAYTNKGSVFQQILDHPELVGNSSVAQFVFRVGGNFMILVFLMVAIKVSEQAGVYGADIVAKAAKGGMFLPFKGAGWVGKKGADLAGYYASKKKTELSLKYFEPKKADGKVATVLKKAAFAAFNPGAAAHSLQEHKEKVQTQLEHAASGRMQEIVASLPWIDRPPLAREAEAIIHMSKEKGEKETPYTSERAARAIVKMFEDKMNRGDDTFDTKLGYIGALDQLVAEKGFNFLLESSKAKDGSSFDVSREGAIKWFQDQVDRGRMDAKTAGHLAAAFSKHAYENKEYWYAEIYKLDHHGHPEITQVDSTGEVVGKAAYETFMNDLEDRFEREVQAQAVADGDTSNKHLQELRTSRRGAFDKLNLDTDKLRHEHPDIFNYKAYLDSQKEAYVNFTKMGARDKIGFSHWSHVAKITPTNKYLISDTTARHMLDATRDNDYSQAGHMNTKKKGAYKKMFRDAGYNGTYESFAVATDKLISLDTPGGVGQHLIEKEMELRKEAGLNTSPAERVRMENSIRTGAIWNDGQKDRNLKKELQEKVQDFTLHLIEPITDKRPDLDVKQADFYATNYQVLLEKIRAAQATGGDYIANIKSAAGGSWTDEDIEESLIKGPSARRGNLP